MRHKIKTILLALGLYEKIYDIIEPFLGSYYKKRWYILEDSLSFVKKGDLCFDIGANEGALTDFMLTKGAKVVAVEPNDRHAKNLKRKFGENSNFHLVEKGVADREGELEFSICEEADDLSTFSENWKKRMPNYKWNKKKIVPVTTLDELIKKYGLPKFCKIDVEGFEDKVLNGLTTPIQIISFEVNDLKNICLEILKGLGYSNFYEKNGDIYATYNEL